MLTDLNFSTLQNLFSQKSNKIYADYNATAPLLPEVKKFILEFLNLEESHFVNPSSMYASAQKINRSVIAIEKSILTLFELSHENYDVIFHSGGTEGINLVFQSLFTFAKNENESSHKKCIQVFYGESDHAAVVKCAEQINRKDLAQRLSLPISTHGFPLLDKWTTQILDSSDQLKQKGEKLLPVINLTYVHNETGIIWPLEVATLLRENLKSISPIIHIDGVQFLGRTSIRSIPESVDAITFSGHKFGALSGCGFTLLKKSIVSQMSPFHAGGGKENTIRAGSLNVLGIFTIFKAIEVISQNYSYDENSNHRLMIERELKEKFLDHIEIIGEKSCELPTFLKDFNGNILSCTRASNTISFRIKGIQGQRLQTLLDLNGLEVGTGPACSSGQGAPPKSLLAMGYSSIDAKEMVRLSFSPFIKESERQKMTKILIETIEKVVKW